jgi:hypothetical protein
MYCGPSYTSACICLCLQNCLEYGYKEVLEVELHDTYNNGIFVVNIPDQEVVQNATKGFVVMTQEQIEQIHKKESAHSQNFIRKRCACILG